MIIKKIGLPSILPDNDIQYLSHLLKLIESRDPEAEVTIVHNWTTYVFTVQSGTELKEDIRAMHEIWGMTIRFIKCQRFLKFYLV